mmetsp:Transcript_26687/g.58502  ORF Transcript_26687/g.58502 Transcript_26687/m.58502 type:complete len:240 (-) Transcript_26687:1391-2110(-)
MCKGTNCAECNARTHRDSPVQSSLAPLAYMSSVSFRYWIISTMLVRTNPCCLAKRFISGRRIISVGLSSETISHSTPARERPARCARSTPASVCPSRDNTPPSTARNGKMCPGLLKSASVVFISASRFIDLERSIELIPVVIPCFAAASTVTVNAVFLGSSLLVIIWGSLSASIRSPSMAMQITPLEYRTMKAMSSGVQASAAMIKSPSFSRFMSSTTTTILPSFTAAMASSTDFRPKQ